ncbi:sigma-w pathway protein ysdB [Mesobacillus zeae]|uniref:Sigma-w pathway protein ysdB n=1 Tax=Mesobacillus zeae TaxID=1917180 RepID=A0A398AZV2_9BACI|nr:sigma-w pathway protein ysdB [Mesobacillus zeae]RID83189.1 sigma-w pathway protein ysdB [Mesobacillus zeae]
MFWIMRLVLVSLLIFIVLSIVKYLINPKRKLDLALRQHKFYYMDDKNNMRKNFFVTHKGALFEGEKYPEKSSSTSVASILVWARNSECVKELDPVDFRFIEKRIHEFYPKAVISWKSPIQEPMDKRSS